MRNYKSKEAAQYFSKNRTTLDDFYESEKFILNKFINNINKSNKVHNILDIGCAAGGLGKSLKDLLKHKIDYLGIDINPESIKIGRKLFKELNLREGDFSKELKYLSARKIDTIISFSCIDWNENFEESIKIILDFCKIKNSDFIFTFRASDVGVNDIAKSYQFVNYNNIKEGEIANYVVLSYCDFQRIIRMFYPSEILISAYIGKPSFVAETPYEKLTFGCIWLRNCFTKNNSDDTYIKGEFPIDLIMKN